MHVGIANPRWREKRSRHSQLMRNPQFCISGKRLMQRILSILSEYFVPRTKSKSTHEDKWLSYQNTMAYSILKKCTLVYKFIWISILRKFWDKHVQFQTNPSGKILQILKNGFMSDITSKRSEDMPNIYMMIMSNASKKSSDNRTTIFS